MAYVISEVSGGRGRVLRWTGPFDMDEFFTASEEMDVAADDDAVTHAMVDAREMVAEPLGVAELHRLSSGLLTRMHQDASFRTAIIAVGGAATLFDEFLHVRDTVALGQPRERPLARVFADYDEGLAWAQEA